MRGMELLVVGTLTFDLVQAPDGSTAEAPGGSAAFAAAAAAPWVSVRMLGVVGPDYDPEALNGLSTVGIDTDGIRTSTRSTQRWHARYGEAGKDRTTVFSDRRILSDFRPRLSPEERRAGALLLGSIHPAVQGSVLDQWSRDPVSGGDRSEPTDEPWAGPSSETRVVALDSMMHWIEEEAGLRRLLPRVDFLFGTSEELMALAGRHSPEAAAFELLQRGPRGVIEKRGPAGARAFYLDPESGHRHRPSPLGKSLGAATMAPGVSGFQRGLAGRPMEAISIQAMDATPVDPTGAGDAFCGAFLGCWLRDGGSEEHGRLSEADRLLRALAAGAEAGARAVSAPSWTGLLKAGSGPGP